jgi:hypothetical protein
MQETMLMVRFFIHIELIFMLYFIIFCFKLTRQIQ